MEGPRLCHGHLVQLGPGQGELVALQLEGDWLTSLASGHGSPSQGGQLSNAHYLPSCVRACVRACVWLCVSVSLWWLRGGCSPWHPRERCMLGSWLLVEKWDCHLVLFLLGDNEIHSSYA